MSLVQQAATGTLPPHQLMDADTLEWIRNNRPGFPSCDKCEARLVYPIDLSCLPVGDWYESLDVSLGIHGISHAVRVSLFAFVIAAHSHLSEREQRFIAVAGLLHDVSRRHDQHDENHGLRASTRLAEFSSLVSGLDEVTLAKVIRMHDDAYEQLDQDPDYRGHAVYVDILKAADALDRYRLPKLKWWLDEDRLRLTLPSWLVSSAFDTVVASEDAVLNGDDPREAVVTAARAAGLLL